MNLFLIYPLNFKNDGYFINNLWDDSQCSFFYIWYLYTLPSLHTKCQPQWRTFPCQNLQCRTGLLTLLLRYIENHNIFRFFTPLSIQYCLSPHLPPTTYQKLRTSPTGPSPPLAPPTPMAWNISNTYIHILSVLHNLNYFVWGTWRFEL